MLLYRDSGVTTISEGLLEEVQARMPGVQLTRSFEDKAWVVTAVREEPSVKNQTADALNRRAPMGAGQVYSIFHRAPRDW